MHFTMSSSSRIGYRPIRLFSAIVLPMALSACVTRVPQVLSRNAVPEVFAGQTQAPVQIWPAQDWWKSFGSTELSDLIATAQRNNLDLAVAAARVLEARAQTTIQRASLLPQFNLQGQ